MLWSIRERKREMDYWSQSAHSLGQVQQADKMHDIDDSQSSLHIAEHSNLRDSEQW